jgi:hypothetical protein
LMKSATTQNKKKIDNVIERNGGINRHNLSAIEWGPGRLQPMVHFILSHQNTTAPTTATISWVPQLRGRPKSGAVLFSSRFLDALVNVVLPEL